MKQSTEKQTRLKITMFGCFRRVDLQYVSDPFLLFFFFTRLRINPIGSAIRYNSTSRGGKKNDPVQSILVRFMPNVKISVMHWIKFLTQKNVTGLVSRFRVNTHTQECFLYWIDKNDPL